MRKYFIILSIIIMLCLPAGAGARMLVLEESLFDAEPGLRLDLVDIYAGYDGWYYGESTTKYEYLRAIENLGVSCTVFRWLEVSAGAQYLYWLRRIDEAAVSSDHGLGQLNAGVKFAPLNFLTLGGRFFYRASRPELELGGGDDIKGYAVLDTGTLYLNAGYVLTGKYSFIEPSTDETVEYDPGEVITGGIGYKLTGEKICFIFELRATKFFPDTVDGTETVLPENVLGITVDFFPGLVFMLGKLQIKIGAGIGLGGENIFGIDALDFNTENSRGPGMNPVKYREISYDLAPVIGISYKF